MSYRPLLSSLALLLCQASAQTVLFSDDFTRADTGIYNNAATNGALDASLNGMVDNTGSNFTANNVYTRPYTTGGAGILSNELLLASGSGTSNASINHNFINAEILTAGGFSISLDVVAFNQSTNGQGGGFGIGMSATEVASAGDALSGSNKMTDGFGNNANPALSDFWLVLRGNSTLEWGGKGNEVAVTEVSVAAKTGIITANFELTDFNDGSNVDYEVFYNGVSQGDGSFPWTGTGENFIGIDARDSNGVLLDNLAVTTFTGTIISPSLNLTAAPAAIPATSTAEAVTLSWTSEDLPAGSTYQVTADKAVTFPNNDASGTFTGNSGSFDVVVNGTLGEVMFTFEALDGGTTIASTTAKVFIERPNVILIMTDDMGWSDFGCYGSEINTPTIDSLGNNGLKYRNFYNTARCSTTRCALLSGLYTHQAATNPGAALPPLDDDNNITIAELLSTTGYRRYMAGKWHTGTSPDLSPIGRGFQHIFGQTSGGNFPHNQVSGGNHASFWDTNNFGFYSENSEVPEINLGTEYPGVQFHQTDFIGEYSLKFIDHHLSKEDGAPFFLYMPFNAVHWDINAPNEMADRYTDVADNSPDGLTTNGGLDGGDFYQYEVGWDQARDDRFARQLALGARDNSFTLAPRTPSIQSIGQSTDNVLTPAWSAVEGGNDRRDDLARRMALYAAMLEMVDQNIKKVVDKLSAESLLDNTLIVILADNGGNYEGGLYGKTGGTINAAPVTGTAALLNLGQPNNPDLHIGGGWANVNNTPFRLFKHFSHEGGIRTPCIIHYPDGITSPGRWIDDRGHLIDIMATISDVTNTPHPATFTDLDENNAGNNSVRTLLPLEGESLAPHFDPATVASFPNRPLGFEHESNRAWIKDNIKLVTKNFDYIDGSSPANELELYDLTTDPTELNNLATSNTALLGEYIDEWNAWASRVGVPANRLLPGITPTVTLLVSPDSIPGTMTSSVTLTFNSSFIPANASYQITASPTAGVSFPSGGASGSVLEGSDTANISVTIDGTQGDTTLTIEILNTSAAVIASASTTVDSLAPEVDPAALPGDLFVDNFNRPDDFSHDASLAGMSGSILGGLFVEGVYYDSHEAGSTEIDNRRLDLADGNGMTETALQHNFIDSSILSGGGFSIQLAIREIDSTPGNDEPNRYAGIAVGLSQAEAQLSEDIDSNSAPFSFRGGTENGPTGTADFFLDLALDGNVRVWSNGVLLETIPVGKDDGTLLLCYEVSSFSSGATVTVTAFLDGQKLDLDSLSASNTRDFTWDNTDTNYVGLSARASNVVTVDNFAIRPLPLSGSLASNYANSFGLSGSDASLTADSDGDGDDNFTEWLRNGDLTANDSYQKLLCLAPSPSGEFRFNYITLTDAQKSGVTHTFRYSTDLVGDPATWPTFTPETIAGETPTSLGPHHEIRLVTVPDSLVASEPRLFLLLQAQ